MNKNLETATPEQDRRLRDGMRSIAVFAEFGLQMDVNLAFNVVTHMTAYMAATLSDKLPKEQFLAAMGEIYDDEAKRLVANQAAAADAAKATQASEDDNG